MTDELASRVHDPDGAGFTEAEQALLLALPILDAASAERAIEILRDHFDVGEDRGEVGQIIHCYGMYKGLHTTMAALGAEILDGDGRPLSEGSGFGVVTMDDGTFRARGEIDM